MLLGCDSPPVDGRRNRVRGVGPLESHRVDVETALRPVDVAAVGRKVEHAAAYSGFEGSTQVHGRTVGLGEWLRERGIDDVVVVGIATDHCVRATALDAAGAGFRTTVLLDLCAGVAQETTDAALEELQAASVVLS